MEETRTLLAKPKENVLQFGATYYFSATSIADHFKDKRTKIQLRLVKSLDTILSLLIVTPLCIANWQSVWFLYDVYNHLFPILESFAFSICILTGWTILRQVIEDSFVKYKRRYKSFIFWRLIKSTYIFNYNLLLVMQWRGAFGIFDMVSSVIMDKLGTATSASLRITVLITIAGAGGLLIMQSFRNALAVPFIIALDKSDKIFFYPTRFRRDTLVWSQLLDGGFSFCSGVILIVLHKMPEHTGTEPSKLSKFELNFDDSNTETATTKFVIVVTILGIIFFIVLYLIIILKSDSHLTENNEIINQEDNAPISTNDISIANANKSEANETLTKAETLIAPAGKYPPRPFINNFRGPSPASFHPTRPRPTGVTYAQLQNYNIGSHVRTPHNIQDIIGFLMPSDKKNPNSLKPFVSASSHDPFYPYKPKDPSDINLLATANLRFAPPIWKEIKANPAPSASSMHPHEMPIYEPQSTKNSRALTLSLNVFPMANDPRKEHYYAVSSNVMSNVFNRQMQQPRKMIIHLNLYQNNEIMMNRGEIAEEDYDIERNLIERSMNGIQQVLKKNFKN